MRALFVSLVTLLVLVGFASSARALEADAAIAPAEVNRIVVGFWRCLDGDVVVEVRLVCGDRFYYLDHYRDLTQPAPDGTPRFSQDAWCTSGHPHLPGIAPEKAVFTADQPALSSGD